MGAPIKGYNTVLEVQKGDGTWLEVAKTRNVPFFKGSNDVEDITTTRSPKRHKQRTVTLRDTAPSQFACIYDPTDPTHQPGSADSMSKLLATGEERNFRATLSNGTSTVVTKCVVTQWAIGDAQASNIIEATCELTPVEAPSSGMD